MESVIFLILLILIYAIGFFSGMYTSNRNNKINIKIDKNTSVIKLKPDGPLNTNFHVDLLGRHNNEPDLNIPAQDLEYYKND